jgi:hypothetical protein
MSGISKELQEQLASPIASKGKIDESDLWSSSSPLVLQATQFIGHPTFYPVFQFGDYYSSSFFALVALKGTLIPNARVLSAAEQPNLLYQSCTETADMEIHRIGGPPEQNAKDSLCASPENYSRAWATAMQEDIAYQEQQSPGFVNVILVGGKDSMNLLLLNWQNPTIVFSSEPNTSLVRDFIARNEIGLEVFELTDPEDHHTLTHEILENGCRADLSHFRWGKHLRDIAKEHNSKVLFWKGQLGDMLTTPGWKKYSDQGSGVRDFTRKVYARLDKYIPMSLQSVVADQILVPHFFDALWRRGAMFQGAHMGVIRAITGCPVYSAYHGSGVSEVWRGVHFVEAVQSDIRGQIGAHLHGGPVWYPDSNPAPPPSPFRRGLCRPQEFFSRLKDEGIEIFESGHVGTRASTRPGQAQQGRSGKKG